MKTFCLLAAVLTLGAISTSAVPILLAPDHPDITVGDPLDGVVVGQPANEASQLARLNLQIATYNAANPGDTLAPAESFSPSIQTPSGPTSITIDVTGQTYLKLKWANFDVYYFVGDDTGEVTFENTLVLNPAGRPQGLSHYTFFQGGRLVPDAGSSLVLLGFALAGISLFKRRLSCSGGKR